MWQIPCVLDKEKEKGRERKKSKKKKEKKTTLSWIQGYYQ